MARAGRRSSSEGLDYTGPGKGWVWIVLQEVSGRMWVWIALQGAWKRVGVVVLHGIPECVCVCVDKATRNTWLSGCGCWIVTRNTRVKVGVDGVTRCLGDGGRGITLHGITK